MLEEEQDDQSAEEDQEEKDVEEVRGALKEEPYRVLQENALELQLTVVEDHRNYQDDGNEKADTH